MRTLTLFTVKILLLLGSSKFQGTATRWRLITDCPPTELGRMQQQKDVKESKASFVLVFTLCFVCWESIINSLAVANSGNLLACWYWRGCYTCFKVDEKWIHFTNFTFLSRFNGHPLGIEVKLGQQQNCCWCQHTFIEHSRCFQLSPKNTYVLSRTNTTVDSTRMNERDVAWTARCQLHSWEW